MGDVLVDTNVTSSQNRLTDVVFRKKLRRVSLKITDWVNMIVVKDVFWIHASVVCQYTLKSFELSTSATFDKFVAVFPDGFVLQLFCLYFGFALYVSETFLVETLCCIWISLLVFFACYCFLLAHIHLLLLMATLALKAQLFPSFKENLQVIKP